MNIPYPISMNRYLRNFRGRTVRSSEAVKYKAAVASIATDEGITLLEGPVSVVMVLRPPKPKDAAKRAKKDPLWILGVRRIDLDNCMKVAIDALQGIAYDNDRQITDLRIRLGTPVPNGGMSIEVRPDLFWSSPV